MSITAQEAENLILRALALHDARRPVPSSVTVAQAAEMLGVHVRTVIRWKLPRNRAGKIPYRDIQRALEAR